MKLAKRKKKCSNLPAHAVSYLAHLNLISHASLLGFVLVESAEFPPLSVLVEVTHLHHELVLGTIYGEAFSTTPVAQCPCLQESTAVLELKRTYQN